MSQQLQHLDSRQSANENNVYAITEKLSSVQTEVTDTINQLNTTVIANQDSNTASQARLQSLIQSIQADMEIMSNHST